MEGERRRCQVLQRQARELVYKVFSYFKREADSGLSIHDAAKQQERGAERCDVSIGRVHGIISEGNVAICISRYAPSLSFVSATQQALSVTYLMQTLQI
jgi:hypothetical protein